MLLREWRIKHELSQATVAAAVGAANATVVSRWELKRHIPRPAEMAALFLVTGGAVTPNDFYDLPSLESAAA